MIDLHTHSNYSDGDLSPSVLIALAKTKNIETIAVTDHDTLLGNKELDFSGDGIHIIPAIELSAKVDKGRMHILGYNIDIYNPTLNKKMDDLQNNSVNSVLSLVEQIKRDYGIVFTYDELKCLINTHGNIGRPNIARILVQKGIVNASQDAFDKYLNNSYAKINKYQKGIPYEECIDLIIRSGGIPVLAHPNTLKKDNLELLKLIREMIACGLQGIEVFHSGHSEEEKDYYSELANKHNLLISGGSDYHGPLTKPNVELGCLHIKQLSILDKIKSIH